MLFGRKKATALPASATLEEKLQHLPKDVRRLLAEAIRPDLDLLAVALSHLDEIGRHLDTDPVAVAARLDKVTQLLRTAHATRLALVNALGGARHLS